ncbi:hypothetical protein [Halalkalicoccus tibetensis]|uniref:Copper chaperone CopZ n=1 Tax=Halalkalicoccus tibetensis TaxID=175632 RepID=A0ABD5V926_9EURY
MIRRRTIDIVDEESARHPEDGLTAIDGIRDVRIDRREGTLDVAVEQSMRDDELVGALRGAGYRITV